MCGGEHLIVISEDGKRVVNVGGSDIWNSLYSTVEVRLRRSKSKISLALNFFKTGMCEAKDCDETARQFNLIRDMLSQCAPDKAVYDMYDREKDVPWKGRLSNVITSCANLYTTADGKDLLYEVVSILCYADVAAISVRIEK